MILTQYLTTNLGQNLDVLVLFVVWAFPPGSFSGSCLLIPKFEGSFTFCSLRVSLSLKDLTRPV